MKFKVKNLGVIEKAEIDLSKDLIILTGYNNTGKTYLNYLLYGLYKLPYGRIQNLFFPLVEIEDMSNEIICLQTNLNKLFTEKLEYLTTGYIKILANYCKEIFASKDITPEMEMEMQDNDLKLFREFINQPSQKSDKIMTGYAGVNIFDDKGLSEINNGIIKISFDRINSKNSHYIPFKEVVKDIIRLQSYAHFENIMRKIASFNHIYQRDYNAIVHFFPAERATLNQYSFDLIFNRSERYEEDSNPYPFETEKNKGMQIPEYPLVINNYIKLVYNLRKKVKQSSDFNYLAFELEQKMLNGNVIIDEQGFIKFQLPNKKFIELYETSSTIKSLAVFVLYLRHIAQSNDVIFIDEPELNLHPKSQIVFARILAKLVNKGIKIILSTHSDYITKELSSLILLSKDFPERKDIMENFGINEDELIDKSNVGLYYFEPNGSVTNQPLNGYGLEVNSIENEIENQSQRFNKIYFWVSEND